MGLGLLGAFAGGLLTLLSPCSVMVLPAFFSYAFAAPSTVLGRTAVFYLGLITTLVPLGVLAGTVGAFVAEHREVVVTIAALVVIALGLLMLSGLPLPFLSHHVAGGTSVASVYTLGTVYGLAGVCAGPVLGTVLTFSAVSGNALAGGVALLVFAAGMAFPLLVLSLLWAHLPAVRVLVRPREIRLGRWRSTLSALIGGAVTVALGVLLLITHGTASLGGGLGASAAVELEGRTLDAASTVPDVVVLAVVVAAAAVALVLVRRRAPR
ncbi:cytochrome c biogenesis CcdA family protein [Rathayibacter rathayi]|uniref:Cytochrome C biogenesis protein CcdA n=1 Tax=Rathayibacter rathayi TaxID=33887 RepID=A0ABD6W7Y9_RATRA|nr:cytochrome c biogenesis protein CcdA [Rathayibacter rathayi]PPF12677.1 cytochrome C biogenesis protein CcdA [Rathayibacter rathayi]PPF20536.1 cytochrome C biogenesis protein CcdA [Rathayibacter rathayi]PPG09668.1 cytochrome C biogenesis protein CcdA [Rathayibacter rathayi]PPG91624.1 cytochrome C biogenesis protein CcdA [Rathayibacter rathayi]PPH96573.1 cytochrome C biogenesis protein CcdA [Rathayibacter rathayi]